MRHIVFSLLLLLSLVAPVLAQDEPAGECEPLAPLVVGEFGRVSAGDANSVRSAPTTSGERIGAIPGGETFAVLDGPRCADGFVWWQVEHQGVTGWTVDGADGDAWLFPSGPAESEEAVSEPPVMLFPTVITPDNVPQLEPVFEFSCETGADNISSLVLSNNQRYLAFNCRAQSATAVYDLLERRQIASLDTADSTTYAFLPGDQQLLGIHKLTSRDSDPRTYAVWDVASGEVVASVPYERHPSVYDAAYVDLVVIEPEQIRRLDARTLEEMSRVPVTEPLDLNDAKMTLSADGATFAAFSSADPGVVFLVDTASGDLLQRIETPFITNILPNALEFSPSGRFVLAAGCAWNISPGFSCGGPAILWIEVASGSIVERWDMPPGDGVRDLAFSPDGQLLAAAARALIVYSVQSGQPVFSSPLAASLAEFSRDGTFVVTTGIDHTDAYLNLVWAVQG